MKDCQLSIHEVKRVRAKTVITFYVLFNNPGHPPEVQGAIGRAAQAAIGALAKDRGMD